MEESLIEISFSFLTQINNDSNQFNNKIIMDIVLRVAFVLIITSSISNADIKLNIGDNHTVILHSNIVIDCGLDCVDDTSFFVAWYFQAANKPHPRLLQNCSCDRICYLGPYTYGTTDITIQQIHNIHISDEGFYTCQVQNRTMRRFETTYIKVEEAVNHLGIIIGIPCALMFLLGIILLVYIYIRNRNPHPYYDLS
jgi:hypothetical protein